jgi:hypothetical protein
MNTIAALISSLVIIKWSVGLLKDSGKALPDMENGNKITRASPPLKPGRRAIRRNKSSGFQ